MRLPSDTGRLIMEAKGGGDSALARLLEENYGAVYHYLLRLTLDSQRAGDIAQDCMIRVINDFARYDPEKAAFSTWMIAIAKNLWLDECRKEKRRRAQPLVCESEPDPADRIVQSDAMLRTLKKMDAKFRVPVLLRHALGYRYLEIAAMLRIPPGTVKSRISTGLAILRKELTGYDE